MRTSFFYFSHYFSLFPLILYINNVCRSRFFIIFAGMKLIIDSGSTKAAWVATPPSPTLPTCCVTTTGINPVRDDESKISEIVDSAIRKMTAQSISFTAADVNEIWFYGAGCIDPYSNAVHRVLRALFPSACDISVESDLLGAARALCGHDEGIACILGTGSNSCLYDGRDIVANVSPLGWILGDEGSGAVLGRTLVGDLMKGQLSASLRDEFLEHFHLTQQTIIEAVYRQPQPNRFLASLVPFLTDHRDDPGIHSLLVTAFRSFLRRNVASYGRSDLEVGFVGGIAYQFENELREATDEEHFVVGLILRNPIDKMVAFHNNLPQNTSHIAK